MALRPTDLKTPSLLVDPEEDGRPLPTDAEVAAHLGVRPELFQSKTSTQPTESSLNATGQQAVAEAPAAPAPIEAPKQPGEGSI